MKPTKRQQLKEYVSQGKTKDALRIAKGLDVTYSKSEIRTLEIAYECLSGKEAFYIQLGENVSMTKNNAISLLSKVKDMSEKSGV